MQFTKSNIVNSDPGSCKRLSFVYKWVTLRKIFFLIASLCLSGLPLFSQQKLIDSTIDSLKIVPESSSYFPFAQQRLAELYTLKRTVSDRKKAETCARNAISLYPNNLDFHMTLVRILYEREAYLAVEEACDKIQIGRAHV